MESGLQPGKMLYRNFGNSGLKVSVLAMGQLYADPKQHSTNLDIVRTCLAHGINHFDTAESYFAGECEKQLGITLKQLGVPREDVVISTKIHTAPQSDINSKRVISRKHIKEALKGSLARLQLDYVDILYAHFYDEFTPLEEVCRSFHEVIEAGLSFYWATSNWSASNVFDALAICQRLNLHRPIGAQNYYHMLNRTQAQIDYCSLRKNHRYGFIGWSPLAGGYLTGKYFEETPDLTARYNKPYLAIYKKGFIDPIDTPINREALKALKNVAKELECELVSLVLAWTLKRKHLDSVVFGTKNLKQLQQTLHSIDLLEKITPQMEASIEKIIGNTPTPRPDFKAF